MKPNWLKDAIAKEDGFYSVKGEKLKNQLLSKSFVRRWNVDAPEFEQSEPEKHFEVTFDETAVSGISVVEVSELMQVASEIEEEVSEIEEEKFQVTEAKTLSDMTKAELLIIAKNNNIEVSRKDKKDVIFETIEKALENKDI